jgi:hypothetical protein
MKSTLKIPFQKSNFHFGFPVESQGRLNQGHKRTSGAGSSDGVRTPCFIFLPTTLEGLGGFWKVTKGCVYPRGYFEKQKRKYKLNSGSQSFRVLCEGTIFIIHLMGFSLSNWQFCCCFNVTVLFNFHILTLNSMYVCRYSNIKMVPLRE